METKNNIIIIVIYAGTKYNTMVIVICMHVVVPQPKNNVNDLWVIFAIFVIAYLKEIRLY